MRLQLAGFDLQMHLDLFSLVTPWFDFTVSRDYGAGYRLGKFAVCFDWL